MKKNMVKTAMLFAAMLAQCAGLFAETCVVDGRTWVYRINNGNAEISRLNPAEGSVVVPSMLDGYRVTSIGDDAFDTCDELTSVTIQDGVVNIGNYAFECCDGLARVTMPNGITNIGEGAFMYCFSLRNVSIPASVARIGNDAFYDCSWLTNILFEGNAPAIGSSAFYRVASDCTVHVRKGSTGWGVNIPGTWNGLRIEYADDGVGPAIYTVTFNANGGSGGTTRSVASGSTLGTLPTPTRNGYTFAGWYTARSGGLKITELTKVTRNVAYYAHWTSAYTVTLNVNGGTLNGVANKVYVQKSKAVGALPSPTRTGYTFKGWYTKKSGGSKISVSTKVKGNITYYAQWIKDSGKWKYSDYGTGGITVTGYTDPVGSIIIPSHIDGKPVTDIGLFAFSWCEKLTSIGIPSSVKTLAWEVFRECTGLKEVHIEDLKAWCQINFGDNPLAYAHNLYLNGKLVTSLDFPVDVRLVNGFGQCHSLKTVHLHGNITEIEPGAFSDCINLTNFVVDANNRNFVASDGVLFSRDMKRLLCYPAGKRDILNYRIPDSVEEVDSGAFVGCRFLKTIYVPARVRCGLEFTNCTSLRSITVSPENAEYMDIEELLLSKDGEYLISVPGAMEIVDVPESVRYIERRAFSGCASLHTVNLHDGVEIIRPEAFAGCENLKKISIPKTVSSMEALMFTGAKQLAVVEFLGTPPFGAGYGAYGLVFTGAPETAVAYYLPKYRRDWEESINPEGKWQGIRMEMRDSSPVSICTVAFNANGGSVDGETSSKRSVVQWGKLGTLPEPVRKGYKFIGWFTTKTGFKKVSSKYVVENSMTLYAHWAEAWTVTFNANGGKIDGEKTVNVMVRKGAALETLPKVSWTGYTLRGWYSLDKSSKVTAKTIIKKNITFYAQWTAKEYAIRLKKIGKGSVSGAGLEPCNSKITLKAKPASGYKFDGWYLGDTLKSKNATWKTKVPLNGATYTAKFSKKTSAKTAANVVAANVASAVVPFPSWAVGTFKGKGTFNGKDTDVTLTVGKTGKISGKFVSGGKAYAFTAASFEEYGDDGVLRTSKGTMKVGDQTYKVEVAVGEVSASGASPAAGVAEIAVLDGNGEIAAATVAK